MAFIPHNDESEIERRLINVLGEGRNQWTYRKDLKSEEDLWNNLREKIIQTNMSEIEETPLSDTEFERIKTELLSRTITPFHAAKWLKGENGIARITISRDDIALSPLSLVLYSNQNTNGGISTYEVVNQISNKKGSVDNQDRRFDVTLLINGLPIIQIELKQITAKDGVFQAYQQIKKYAEEGAFHNNIFSTLQIFVISNEQTTRYFANALPKYMDRKFIFAWRTKENKKVEDLYEFSKEVLNIPDAHKLIADYTIVSEDQDNKTLMVLHPYQIHAIRAIYEAASHHRSGYVWHATGSGKTLTSFVATKLLARKPGVDRTIMLIDRKDLDNQTTSEFTKFASEFNTGISTGKAASNALIVGTDNSQNLHKALISENNNNTIIITTRQKLEQALQSAKKKENKDGKKCFEKLKSQHIIFVVDECHRALSAEGMKSIKSFFNNSTWFGFTGTPIFPENKKQAKGQNARTTFEQYGEVLHTYTIKNALDDNAVLGFQVEHEDTIEPNSLNNSIFEKLRLCEKHSEKTDDELNDFIDKMDDVEKEDFIESKTYESDQHIQKVLRKIFKPDNAYIKFDFENGRPKKSAILTTSSISMAKRYYFAIKKMTQDKQWIEKEFPAYTMRKSRTINDPGFPRIAITYSMQENQEHANEIQNEMAQIIKQYNENYGTAWTAEDMARYNGDINNRLARKKGEFKEFGKQIDLVIVVERLLTGFDAPTLQTLFVDRNLSYANLIQAFSRTNRTYPQKAKGLIVTFRKPKTMQKNVEQATKLYSQEQQHTNLIYPTYKESKKRFLKAHKLIKKILPAKETISETSPLEIRIEFVKTFQELNNAFGAIKTYDEYNNEVESIKELGEKIKLIEDYVGVYYTIKGSLIEDEKDKQNKENKNNFSSIEFFSENIIQSYDIDLIYINKLLDDYSANNEDVRNEIERALKKMGKHEIVKSIYRDILNNIDKNELEKGQDIISVKRRFFKQARDKYISEFANYWFVSFDELNLSAAQYKTGADPIPNIGSIINSACFEEFKKSNSEAKKIKYNPTMKRKWKETLENNIVPIDNELQEDFN